MEWNLSRMKQSRASSSSYNAAADQNLKLPLLSSSDSRKGSDDPNKKAAAAAEENSDLLPSTKITALLDLSQDLVLILTCCVCCLCFGVAAIRLLT
ncbi:uncharacterized protein A4U43_C04F250 [Asparagus officinalis]|uniref:Uncharacterized protein n=1 Tax=Asparagus officinalis TaxID=4686 RepID=A0A5P1EX76_ASPOF|nr:uncharacterized protein A4U43_C04F250 [Asparagus officinalis]